MLGTLSFCYAQHSENTKQADSTLYKIVKGIQQVVNKRAIDDGYHHLRVYLDRVRIKGENGTVPVDSLYKYTIADYRSISVELDLPYAIFGATGPFGTVYLHRAEYQALKTPASWCTQHSGNTRQIDSTLYKMVKGIQQVVNKRTINDSCPKKLLKGCPGQVHIKGESRTVSVDSLYKYTIADYRSISIEFGLYPALSGSMVPFGVIYLHRKEGQG